MSGVIKVALLGLGEVGQVFAEELLEKIQEDNKPIEIVAVAHRDTASPVALGFKQNGVQVFQDALEVIELGEAVDIIFDLTGDRLIRHALRERLQATGNRHTVLAPEVVATLLWHFFGQSTDLVSGQADGY